MNVSPEHEADLIAMSDERKWKLIRNDVRVVFFVVVSLILDRSLPHL